MRINRFGSWLTALTALAVVAGGALPGFAQSNAQAQLVDGNNAFAFDLYGALRTSNGNIVFSPYSISLALAMTYAGARGETAAEMAQTLHFTLAPEELHAAFGALDASLPRTSDEVDPESPNAQRFRLNVANALWGQAGYPFKVAFLALLAEHYGAGLQEVDYINAAEQARQTINGWVADQTEDRIQNLIPEGVLTGLTRLVLTNAIYFNAAWLFQFEEAGTFDGPFYLRDGSTVTVPTMAHSDVYEYVQGGGFQAVTLPYQGQRMAMTVIMPEMGTYDAFEAGLTAQQFEDIRAAMGRTQMRLYMPRWEGEAQFNLGDTLAALGMPLAFSPGADFTGMADVEGLLIDDVIHKAFIKVDEQGTEAAAATAVIMRATAAMGDAEYELYLDHPYMVVIHDLETGTILFMGRVLNPAG